MVRYEKAYLDVTERRLKDGTLIPLSFEWEDGEEYAIEVMGYTPAPSLKVGGAGIRYKCKVLGKVRYMFLEVLEETRWYVEKMIFENEKKTETPDEDERYYSC